MGFTIKILIVDDHPIVANGLKELLTGQKNIDVCGIAADQENAITLFQTQKPDMCIVDISLKNSNGLELIKTLIHINERINILVLSMHDEELYAERAMKAGAKGYIMKHNASEELLNAVKSVAQGRIYLSESMKNKILIQSIKGKKDESEITEILSDRELEVLEYTGKGLTTKEVSDLLFLDVKTIETYKNKIKQKLNLENNNKLIKFAVEWVNKV